MDEPAPQKAASWLRSARGKTPPPRAFNLGLAELR